MDTETAPEVSISERNNDLNKLAYEIANSEPRWRIDVTSVIAAAVSPSEVGEVNGNACCGGRNGSGI